MPSLILIRPTVWPQYTNVTDKTDRETGQTQQSVALAEVYLRTKWHLNLSSRLATTDMGHFLGGSWVPILHNVAWAESTSMLCFILINEPLGNNTTTLQTDRTDRTGQRSDNVRRTDFGRPFVKRFALCYQTVVCLSVCPVCLSVCDAGVLCQMVGWIKMKLGMLVGLGPGHIVLD